MVLIRQVARWWAARSAGGLCQVLKKTPEALARMTLGQVVEVARPLAARAGVRLSTWAPVTLLKDGAEVVLRIPPRRGLKYVGAQLAQAGMGIVGLRKMEERLASRRPRPWNDEGGRAKTLSTSKASRTGFRE